MEPSQEVEIPLEKGNTFVEGEIDSGGDSDLEDTKAISTPMESTKIHWETNGKSISTVHVPKNRLLHRFHSTHSVVSEDTIGKTSNVFTFSNESINQESKEEVIPVQSISISTHSIRSPREKRKAPSSPVHNRVRANRPQLSTGPSTITLKAVSFRRNRPSVNASWIQSKAGTIRNSWSSRNHAVPPITVVTSNSACNSPRLDTSDNSLDIVIKPPPQYVSHRYKLNELNSIHVPFPHFAKEPLEMEAFSPIVLSRTQSISPFDRDSFNDSLMAESPLPPYTSTARLLNVSHDLTPDELQPPTESIYINVSSSRRPILSILPSLSPVTHIIGDHTIVTDLSSYNTDQDSDPSELNRLDFSQLKYSDKPIAKSGEITEDMTETITALMNERNEYRSQGWKGEELEGGQVSSEDDLIDGTYFGHSHRSNEAVDISPLSAEISPLNPEHISPIPTPAISREPTPHPLALSDDMDEVESCIMEEEKTPEPPPPSFDVMSMDIDQMLSLSSPPMITSSSLPPSPPPIPIIPPPIPVPAPIPEDYTSPPVEKKIYLPTEVQIQLVNTLELERAKRYKEREEEEERRKQELMKRALQERLELIEKRNQSIKENLQKRESLKQVSFRNDKFSYLFGDCSFLLLPYVCILDYIFGPILKPTDDLLHLADVLINYINKGDLDYSPFAKRVVKSRYLSARAQMILEVQNNPYLQSFFKNFAFYYQCALNYTYKKITCYI